MQTVYDSSFQIVRKISLGLQPGESCVGLYFFQESFDAPNVPHRRHLLVHTRDVESDYVNIVAIDGPPSVLKDSTASNQHARVEETIRQRIAKDSLIAVSPTQGIFATGTDNGTVNVWYCSPTWGWTERVVRFGRTSRVKDNGDRVYIRWTYVVDC